ncbi:MAG: putative copper resistance protein [Jatrophihabitans sp.]|nr:putative copper resistance protein [Jatrophihabitans sp.]
MGAWTIAAAVIAGLTVAVVHYLSETGSSHGMPGMHMGTAEAFARAGGSPAGALLGSRLLTAWQLDSVALAVIVVLAAAYLTGVARSTEPWPVQRTVSFLLGLAVCGYATCGGVAVYDQVLFTAHMGGHLALVMVAPVLLVAGYPLSLLLAASGPSMRARVESIVTGRVVSLLTAPPVALASYTVVIVGSHLTGVMDTVMRHTWAGQVEHLVYLLVGMQFFVLVVGSEPIRWRLGTPVRWLLLAVAMAVDTFTGVVLLQGTHPVGMLVDPRLHVDALSDTRTGGAIMWFGGDAIMAAVMIILVVGWLRHVDTEKAEAKGWLEQARVATFAAHTGTETDTTNVETFDDDDAARSNYNDWLAQLDRRG